MKKLNLLFAFIFLFSLIISESYAQDKYTLNQLIDYALKNNIQLKRSQNQALESKEDYTRSRANTLPTVNGNGSHNYNYGRTVDPTTNQFSTQRIQTDYLSLNSNLLLFSGLQHINQIRQAKWLNESNTYAIQKQKDDIKLTIANYYLQIIMLSERERQLQSQMKNSQEQYDKTKILTDAGSLAESKLLEASAQVATDNVSLIDIQNQVKNVYLNLKQYLNYDMQKSLEVEIMEFNKSVQEYVQSDLDRVVNERASSLPYVKQAESNLESTKFALMAAKGGYYPSLYANGSLHSGYSSGAKSINGYTYTVEPIGYLSTDHTQQVLSKYAIPNVVNTPYNDQLSNNYGQSIGFQLSIPIFNGLQSQYNVQVAKINYSNAELSLKEAQNKVKYDIYQAFENMQMSSRKYQAASAKLKLQKSLFDKAELSHDNGLMGYYDYNAAKNAYNSALSDELQSRYENIFQTKVFEYYLGKDIQF